MEITKSNLKTMDNIFNDAKKYFIDSYPNTILMFLLGNWYKIFNTDAQIVATIMDYKLFDDNYSPNLGNVCCGFPETAISKVINKLEELKINFITIDTSNWSYKFHDWQDYNNYNNYLEKEEKEPQNESILKVTSDSNSLGKRIKIRNRVEIINIKTKETEIYTILPTYYKYTPKSVSRYYKTFGMIEYKKELDYKYDISKGEISSESPFAKLLLQHCEKEIIEWKDEDGNKCNYLINKIFETNNGIVGVL